MRARARGDTWHGLQSLGPSRHRTADRNPPERLGLPEDDLAGLLDRYRQSFNLGVEDLARLIGAAELQAAARSTGPLTADAIMSRDLITVRAETGLGEVADLLRRHRFTWLPVVDGDARFLGVIFQMPLINQAREDSRRRDRGFGSALQRLLDPGRDTPVRAGDIMNVAGTRAVAGTQIGVLLHMLAERDVDAVPVLEHGRIIGIVTRTGLIAAMARTSVHSG